MLIEREAELSVLRAMLHDALAGNGRLAAVSGEAGVGKTTLVSHIVRSCPQEVAVRRGTADNVTAAAALGVVLEALPELAADAGQVTRTTRLELLDPLGAGLPADVLVLEDLHWADEASLDLLRYVGRRLDGIPVLVVGTFRAEQVPARHPLSVVLGELGGPPSVTRMAIKPLTEGGVSQLVQVHGGPVDAAQLHQRTGQNPFYVTEFLLVRRRAADDVPGCRPGSGRTPQ